MGRFAAIRRPPGSRSRAGVWTHRLSSSQTPVTSRTPTTSRVSAPTRWISRWRRRRNALTGPNRSTPAAMAMRRKSETEAVGHGQDDRPRARWGRSRRP